MRGRRDETSRELIAHGFLLVNAFSQVILKYAGSDCSEDLALHSPGAQALWRHYCIGRLRVCLELRDCVGTCHPCPLREQSSLCLTLCASSRHVANAVQG